MLSELKSGHLISGISSEFPFLIFVSPSDRIYLVPRSIFFTESYGNKSKSQRAKTEMAPNSGDLLNFKAIGNVVQYFAPATQKDKSENNSIWIDHKSQGSCVKTQCVISPEIAPRCWTYLFGSVPIKLRTEVNPLRNVLYEALIRMRPVINGKYCGADTDLRLEYHFVTFIRPCIDTNSARMLLNMEWNINNEETQATIYEISSEEETDCALVDSSQLVRRHYRRKTFYLFENNRTIWPENPRRRILFSPVCTRPGRQQTPAEGYRVRADLAYCRFNSAYIAYNYKILTNHKRGQFPLTKRITVNESGSITEYLIEVTPSIFAGYFACPKFGYVLISDPNNLMRNIDKSSPKRWPVWVALNEFDRIDKFSITELDKKSKKYQETDLPRIWHNIDGSRGFIVNYKTGVVYSPEYPRLPFVLTNFLRSQFNLGEFFWFNAIYSHKRHVYVIVNASPISGGGIQLTYIQRNDKILFEHGEIFCFSRVCLNTHHCGTFGFISDPKKLITKWMVRKGKWPSQTFGYIYPKVNISGLVDFELYSIRKDLSDVSETEEPVQQASVDITACGQTDDRFGDDDSEEKKRTGCKCIEAVRVCRELLADIEALEIVRKHGLFDNLLISAQIDYHNF